MRRRTAALLAVPALAISTLTAQAPVQAQDPGARAPARESLRPPLTRENFYFVMTDRYRNADRSNDRGGLTGSREVTG